MLFSFVYLIFASLLKLLIGSGGPAQVKDIELIVLRHQLDVLRLKGAITSVASSFGEDWEDPPHVLLLRLPRRSGSARSTCSERSWPECQGHRVDGVAPRA